MNSTKSKILRAALSAIHFSGAYKIVAPYTRGRGIIFMLHRVTPEPVREFEPNRILRITPEFFESVIKRTRAAGFDIISLDEAHARLVDDEPARRPFACFTFDDGYRDNLEYAYPILKRNNVPAAIYVPSNFPDGGADLWWLTLEHVLRVLDEVSLTIDGHATTFDCSTTMAKEASYENIYWWLRKRPETEARGVVRGLADQAGIDPCAIARDMIMSWDDVRVLAADPLVTIGAHTSDHYALSKLTDEDSAREIAVGIRTLEKVLDITCRHFAYPYGDKKSAGEREFKLAARLGLSTAVTTQKGMIRAEHRDNLTALPRLSLNGDYQDLRYIDVLMSGLPFALLNTLSSYRDAGRQLAASWTSSRREAGASRRRSPISTA